MASRKKTTTKSASRAGRERSTGSYAHPEASALLRPEAGTQAQSGDARRGQCEMDPAPGRQLPGG